VFVVLTPPSSLSHQFVCSFILPDPYSLHSHLLGLLVSRRCVLSSALIHVCHTHISSLEGAHFCPPSSVLAILTLSFVSSSLVGVHFHLLSSMFSTLTPLPFCYLFPSLYVLLSCLICVCPTQTLLCFLVSRKCVISSSLICVFCTHKLFLSLFPGSVCFQFCHPC
jgi:hypothetical protein